MNVITFDHGDRERTKVVGVFDVGRSILCV